VGLERGPLSLMNTTEELLGRKSSGSGLERREYGRGGSVTLTTLHHLSTKMLALTSPTCGICSIGMARWRTQATEVSFFRFNNHHTSHLATAKYYISNDLTKSFWRTTVCFFCHQIGGPLLFTFDMLFSFFCTLCMKIFVKSNTVIDIKTYFHHHLLAILQPFGRFRL
jgi:hypothetical protein